MVPKLMGPLGVKFRGGPSFPGPRSYAPGHNNWMGRLKQDYLREKVYNF